ncbi:MAG: hypothetical protein WAN22_29795 [Solirubrobacteraceae bacterium]
MSSVRLRIGHVHCVERAHGPVWYAKYRLPDGRRVQKKIGPAWGERRALPGMVRTGATFADAAAEWLRFIGEDRARQAVDPRRLPLGLEGASGCRRSAWFLRCSSLTL